MAQSERTGSSEINTEAQRFKRGESTIHQCGNVVATAWKDKVVNVVSTLAL